MTRAGDNRCRPLCCQRREAIEATRTDNHASDRTDGRYTGMRCRRRGRRLIQAGARLAARGFIEGPDLDQLLDPLRARPTVKGEDYVESGKDVHEQASSLGSTRYSIHGDVQIAHNNQNVMQVQSSNSVRQDTRACGVLQQVIPAMAPNSKDQFAQLAAELRVESTCAARPSRLRETCDSILKPVERARAARLRPRCRRT